MIQELNRYQKEHHIFSTRDENQGNFSTSAANLEHSLLAKNKYKNTVEINKW